MHGPTWSPPPRGAPLLGGVCTSPCLPIENLLNPRLNATKCDKVATHTPLTGGGGMTCRWRACEWGAKEWIRDPP